MQQERKNADILAEKIGYSFKDPALFQEALTHKSFSNEQAPEARPSHNERLEFLGDAVLDLVVSHILFHDFPFLHEGEMTRIRAEVVSEKNLAVIGRELGLGACLRLGRGEERSGGRDKDSLLADTLEAVLGAAYCDSGWEGVKSLTGTLFIPSIENSVHRKVGLDFKTRLQEIIQARHGCPPDYHLIMAEGPDHQRTYTVEVRVAGITIGCGSGRTKKSAEQEAACRALEGIIP